jgi:vancomycin resistance protein VanJ
MAEGENAVVVEPHRAGGDVETEQTPTLPRPRSGDGQPGESSGPHSEDGVDSDLDGYEPTRAYGDEEPAGEEGRPWPSARQQIGTGVAVLGWGMVAFLIAHRFLPDSAGLVELLETWLPWLAVPIALLLITAISARSIRAVLATGVATAVWLGGYGPELLPRGDPLPANLRVVSEDVNASSVELAAVGQLAPNQHADVVTLQHVPPSLAASSATENLNTAYGYHITQYEFGVWSRYPLSDPRAVDLTTTTASADSVTGLVAADVPHVVVGALRVTVATPQGPFVLYVVHIPQPVLGEQGFAQARDDAVARLAKTVRADDATRLAIVGDVNVSQTDRRFSDLSAGLGLTSAQAAAGRGFGFTWPAEFPVVRLDDLLMRGGTPVRSVVLPALSGGKTHLPIEIDIHL